MKILYLGYDRNLEIEGTHSVMYLDRILMDRLGDEWKWIIDFYEPDLLIEREFNDGIAVYDDVIAYINERHPNCKKAIWLIDTHVGHDRHIAYSRNFDYVFMAVSKFVDEFKTYNHNTFWLPLCFPGRTEDIQKDREPLRHDIVFVGRWNKEWFPERSYYIDFLKSHYGDGFLAVTDYDNMRSLIRSAKVSFNCAIRDDMNFRVFESMALGAELVTNDVDDLHKITGLIDRIHVYKDQDDCVRIIDSILASNAVTNALDNQDWIKEKHCLIHRFESMLSMIVSGFQEAY